VPINDAEVKKAAAFAVSAEAKRSEKEIELIDIVKAERQSASGSNYRMCLKVSTEAGEGQDAVEVFVKAIVNFDTRKNAKLLSWEASDCGQDEEGELPAVTGFVPNKTIKPVSKNDIGAGMAADFAVRNYSSKTKSKVSLGEIVEAEDKELGLMNRNFRLCLQVTKNGKPSSAQAVVSMDQYSNLKLLSWVETKC
jgi:hypothetical protein